MAALFVNERKTVVISSVSSDGRTVSGYVRSNSRASRYHKTTIDIDGNDITGGECTCESAFFYGRPCKHMLRLRNAAVRVGLIENIG